MNKRYFFLLFLILFTVSGFAQEVIYGLEHNPAILKKLQEKASLAKGVKTNDTVWVALPFYDDFSALSVWPDTQKWMDQNAFVNAEYGKNPLTIGVATLDMLDAQGNIYADASPYGFYSDTLTSQPIRLDSIFSPVARPTRVSDSIYLSFYYQPQGNGFTPNKIDSLILEFHSPSEFDTLRTETDTTLVARWNWIWSTSGGIPADSFASQNRNIYFKEIFIPIRDVRYLQKGFQFRFRNYASLASNVQPDWQGNGSQWNLDLVYLNVGRANTDTVFRDLAFAAKGESFLKDFESMPYHQYRAKEISSLKESVSVKIANLDNANRNLSYKYDVYQGSNPTPIKTYNGGEESLLPFLEAGYDKAPQHANPPVEVIFPPSTEQKLTFHIIHTLTPTSGIDINPENNVVHYDQIFNNYYAYDDGSAEAGTGINGAAGMYAVAFKLNKRDSLHGIKLFINKTKAMTNQMTVDLCVWNNSQLSTPKDIKLRVPSVTIQYSGNLNEFVDYWFPNTLMIEESEFPDLVFYVGWKQNSVNNLNVGLDRNTDSHLKRYYNVDGTWKQSTITGSMMLRPLVGYKNPLANEPEIPGNDTFSIYPNPVGNGNLNIVISDEWQKNRENIKLRLLSISGQTIYHQKFDSKLDVSGLAKGLYLLQLTNTLSGKTMTQKVVVN